MLSMPTSGAGPTTTSSSRASLIAGVGVETLLDCGSRQLQDLLPDRQLQRFQIQVLHRLTTEQRLNLLHDVAGQEISEEVFFTPFCHDPFRLLQLGIRGALR